MNLYVLGAGASKALNPTGCSYPIGTELKDHVLDLFQDYLDKSRMNRSADRSKYFIDFIERYDSQRPGGIAKNAVQQIYKSYLDSTVETIDEHVAFVRQSKRCDVDLAEAIFQVAVGLVLAFCEMPPSPNHNWMRSFLRRYESGPEEFRVITFNYDRSFQCRYMSWLESRPRVASYSYDVVRSGVRAVYGSLFDSSMSVPYGDMKGDLMNVANARHEIKFMRTGGGDVSPKFNDVDFSRIEIHGLHPRLENFRWIPLFGPTLVENGLAVRREKIDIICNVYDGKGHAGTLDKRVKAYQQVFSGLGVDIKHVEFVDRSLDDHFS